MGSIQNPPPIFIMPVSLSTPLPDPSVLVLRSNEMTLELAPAVGGSIARFYSTRDGVQQHWLRPASAQALQSGEPEAMGSFPLIPFCNRIRDGRAQFQDRAIAMPPNRGNSPHTIHGTAWQNAWSVIDSDNRSARLELSYPGGAWPYRFHATQLFELQPDGLYVTMAVENRDAMPMPIGIGHHPYLPHRPGTRLTVAVSAMWGGDAEVMPTGLEYPPLLDQLRTGVELSGVVQDNNFIGWNHVARVDWPASDTQPAPTALTLQATAPLDYFVLYSPAGADHFCIEPVSNCTDWLNLGQYSQAETGGAVIAPGESYRAGFSLLPLWLAA